MSEEEVKEENPLVENSGVFMLPGTPIYYNNVEEYEDHMKLYNNILNPDPEWIQKISDGLRKYFDHFFSFFEPTEEFKYSTEFLVESLGDGDFINSQLISNDSHFTFLYILSSQTPDLINFIDTPNSWYNNIPKVFDNWPNRHTVPDQTPGTMFIFPSSTDFYTKVITKKVQKTEIIRGVIKVIAEENNE